MLFKGVADNNLGVMSPDRKISRDLCADHSLLPDTKHRALTVQEYNN